MGNYDKAGFLFATPSFLSGIAATVDMGGTLVIYNDSETTQEADARALACDWSIVGDDLMEAIYQFEQETQE